ncbi:Alpha-ketoglutarate-dependent dioxygenase alkB 6 [Hypsizygus marmoreus]|uniref:Alpha-ketoglutarate-dependent dioxygenase alkB 6 n=1 Tax=Hypsizygus marmoreus TaxID=39966 RepID=A0A369JDD9_HYPMA|nr:Alpha-ketoglutarate-dependent dioxygenase alkB 6 [Hypsizygus marmoreus]
MTIGGVELSAHRVAGHETFYIPDFVTASDDALRPLVATRRRRVPYPKGQASQVLSKVTKTTSFAHASRRSFDKITEVPQQKWKQLTNRRLQLWGGEITSKNVLFTQDMPYFVEVYPDIIPRLKRIGAFASSPHGAPNHVILNEPHEDGPAYYPIVATLSLGSHSVFHYHRYKTEGAHELTRTAIGNGRIVDPAPALTVLLERRSLIISRGPMYTSHLHGIRGITEDRISRDDSSNAPILTDMGVEIANWDMLSGEEVKRVMQEGGVLKRDVRYSLTCRDVERVASVKSFTR